MRGSKPVGEDGAAVEVTAEVGASKPITAGDVVCRAGHGPGESVRADHGGDEVPGPGPAGGRGAPCAGEPAQESLLKEEKGEGKPHAHCAPG